MKSGFVMLAAAALTSLAFAATPANAGPVEKLPSGVIVEHLTQGTGPQPTADSVVQ
ncbi:MAG TPA: FKBP-type peptidyl-prolyl cis-trans isomerase, partial [Paraburkholderia sp.]|nr:FKBP-type peptidyl-prolyl cis-trans isomerase [Paraburkholderia sp.]